MKHTIKLALGCSTLLASSVVVGGAYLYSQIPKNIHDQLVKEGYQLLDLETEIKENQKNSESYQRWKKLTEDNSETQDAKQFADWKNDRKEYKKIEKMRKQCKETMDVKRQSKKFPDKLEKAKKFCTKEKVG